LMFLSFPIATFSNLFAKSKSTFRHVTANTDFVSIVHTSNMLATPVARLVLFIVYKKDVFCSVWFHTIISIRHAVCLSVCLYSCELWTVSWISHGRKSKCFQTKRKCSKR